MTEFELIKGCIKQQANCQRMLYEQYSGKLMAVCLRYAKDSMEAEDMLQDAFVRIFNYINQFKFEGSFEGWMRRITVNVTGIRRTPLTRTISMPFSCVPKGKNILSPHTVFLILTALSLLLVTAGGANAATYYVSPGGSDSVAGTSPGAAWGTFAHAMTVIQAGDTLLLEDGTYNQSLNITVSGTSSAYVTVKALNDGQAIVSTSYPASPLAIRHQSYIEVDGINFRNSGQYDSNVYCATDGLGYTDTDGLSIYYDDHIILRRDTSNGSSGCNSAVISLCADTNSLVEDCAASGQGRVVFDMLGSQNVTVRRSWLNWTGPDTGGGDVPSILQIYDSSNILFENNIGSNLTTTSTDVFSIFGHYGSVSGNKVIGNIIYVLNTTGIGGLRDDAVSGNTSTGEFFTNNVVIQAGGYGGDEQGANY
ncbi:sigma factor, partial [Hydrotalea sp.]|uniref:sigma factor n=1 Tax=Hydrotalea sp. TaxID=2881279 RepID=UPI00262FD482